MLRSYSSRNEVDAKTFREVTAEIVRHMIS
jgi:hypothetical protein